MKRFCGIVVLMMVVGAVSHGESPQASGQAQIPDQHDGDADYERDFAGWHSTHSHFRIFQVAIV